MALAQPPIVKLTVIYIVSLSETREIDTVDLSQESEPMSSLAPTGSCSRIRSQSPAGG